MIIFRLASIALRFAQFVCVAVVLVQVSYLLHHRQHEDHDGSSGRLIYSVIVATASIVASLIWLFPTTSHVVNLLGDTFFCGPWIAVFGLLQDWYEDAMGCGSIWAWDEMTLRNGLCSKWNAAQGFSFLSAVLWFVSFILGLLVWRGAGRKRDGQV
jgi:hypothetical protein